MKAIRRSMKAIWRSVRSILRSLRYPIAILLFALGVVAIIGGKPALGAVVAIFAAALAGLFYGLDRRRRNRDRTKTSIKAGILTAAALTAVMSASFIAAGITGGLSPFMATLYSASCIDLVVIIFIARRMEVRRGRTNAKLGVIALGFGAGAVPVFIFGLLGHYSPGVVWTLGLLMATGSVALFWVGSSIKAAR